MENSTDTFNESLELGNNMTTRAINADLRYEASILSSPDVWLYLAAFAAAIIYLIVLTACTCRYWRKRTGMAVFRNDITKKKAASTKNRESGSSQRVKQNTTEKRESTEDYNTLERYAKAREGFWSCIVRE